MLNYNHLYYFYEVAKFGNVSHAAKHLHVSQPSLSIQIKVLEEQLGFKLLEKKGRNIVLTEKGQKLYAQCSRMFQATQDILSRFEEKDKIRPINIGLSKEVEASLIIEISQRVNQKINSVFKIRLIAVEEEALQRKDAGDNIDIYITNRRLINNSILNLYKTLNIPINLFQSRVHKVNTSNLILPGEPLMLRSETNNFLLESSIKDYHSIIETDFISSMVRSVIDGYGVSYLPISYMLEPMQEGLVIKSGPKRGYWHHSLNIYWKNQDSLNEWILRFTQKLINSTKV